MLFEITQLKILSSNLMLNNINMLLDRLEIVRFDSRLRSKNAVQDQFGIDTTNKKNKYNFLCLYSHNHRTLKHTPRFVCENKKKLSMLCKY